MRLKKLFFIIFILGTTINAQESKLKFHSISGGIGLTGSSSNITDGFGGFVAALDIATTSNSNLFSIFIETGSQSLIISEENYRQINLTYGREWSLNDLFSLELHGGFGYFKWDTEVFSLTNMNVKQSENTIGFPIRLKLIFNFSNQFGLGLNPNLNVNSLANTYSINLTGRYKF